MSQPPAILVGIAECGFYLASLAVIAWFYFQTLLKIAEWRGRPPMALALVTYVLFVGVSFAPLLAVERALAWPALSASGRSRPEILFWVVSFAVSFGAMFFVHRRRLQEAGYFRR